MAAHLANAFDFVFSTKEEVQSSSKDGSSASGMKALHLAFYVVCFVFCVGMHDYAMIPGLSDISFVYFIASCLTLIGFLSLLVKVKGHKTVSGISAQSLVISGTSIFFKVLSTTFYDGYLPADLSADFMLQIVDASSLCVVIYLLYAMHKTHVHTYQEEYDTLPVLPIIAACFVAAFFIHADLNRCDIFDTIWAFSLNTEVFQTLPQLFMITKMGGAVEKNTVHYVVNSFLACVFRIGFWLWAIPGCEDLANEDRISMNMRLGGFHILGCYFIEFIIHLDFMYYYVKSWVHGDRNVSLPKLAEEI